MYESERGVNMADGEAERESGLSSGPDVSAELPHLEERLQELESHLRMIGGAGEDEALQAASDYCQRFCQVSESGAVGEWPLQAGAVRLYCRLVRRHCGGEVRAGSPQL